VLGAGRVGGSAKLNSTAMKPVSKSDVWKAIWLAENKPMDKVVDFLRSLLPQYSPASSKGRIKVAVVVGHNSKATGAYAPHPVNKSEFEFNSLVAKEMVALASYDDEIQVKVFYRKPISSYSLQIDEVYSRVNRWDPDRALELHFNWLAQAGRVEMAHYVSSKKGASIARNLLKAFTRLMKTTTRKSKLLPRGKNDRGGRSLWACKCPIVLTEPFDCSNMSHLMRVDELGIKAFAETYINTIKHRTTP